MADPLLTSLCTICHVQEPKYTCPRCSARTCSLACVKKHKNWSSCNGERDPTVFIPREKLKTDAGVDHDYNFLTKIERSVERTERILREEREILPEERADPRPNKRARLHKGQSRGRVTLDNNSRKWDRNSLQRMQQLGINVSSVPYGMTRSKENNTTWNRRTRTMNWQVEWIELRPASSGGGDESPKHTRIMHKLLDETPLYIGFAESQEWHRQRQLSDKERLEEKKALKKGQELPGNGQDVVSTAWRAQPCLVQNQSSAAWSHTFAQDGSVDGQVSRDRYRFFFHKPKTPSKTTQTLIPLKPTDTLSTLLPGLDIVEFPTIYVLPASGRLPGHYTIERRPGSGGPRKRKGSALVEYPSSAEASGDEDGEVMEHGPRNEASDDATSSSGSDSDTSSSD